MSNETPPDLAPLSVVAVVLVNKEEALVLNRPLRFVYTKQGKDYIGTDGPFRDLLRYERGGGRFVAFAGREMHLLMEDGTTATVKDHWWHAHTRGHLSVAYGDVESLKKNYVFYGGVSISPEDFAALRSTYTGCVYPYRDYEKVINYDELRCSLHKKIFALEDGIRSTRPARKALRQAEGKDETYTRTKQLLALLDKIDPEGMRWA